jgi:hypothetical protein
MDSAEPGFFALLKLHQKELLIAAVGLPVVLITVLSLVMLVSQKQHIQDNWVQYRCHPGVIPIASQFVDGSGAPVDMAANFQYCVSALTKQAAGTALEPVNYLMGTVTSVLGDLSSSLDRIRSMISGIRSFMATFIDGVMQKMLGIMSEVVALITRIRDLMDRMLGTGTLMMALTSTMLQTVESVFGMVISFVKAMIYAVFALSFILSFVMPELLVFAIGLGGSMGIVFCFDPATEVEVVGRGPTPMSEVKVGEVLQGQHTVEGVMRMTSSGTDVYDLDGVLVSGYHKVYFSEGNEWIYVKDHPRARLVTDYASPELVCLITDTHEIPVAGLRFVDYEEVEDCAEIEELVWGGCEPVIPEDQNTGVAAGTHVLLWGGGSKPIEEMQVGDRLVDRDLVQGVIELDTAEYKEWYRVSGNLLSGTTWVERKLDNQPIRASVIGWEADEPVPPRAYALITKSGWYTLKEGRLRVRDYLDTHDPLILQRIDAFCLQKLNS